MRIILLATAISTIFAVTISMPNQAHAQAARLKICMDPDSGDIRARRACRGFFSRELSKSNLVTGAIIDATVGADGTLYTASERVIGPVVVNSTGSYTINLDVTDVLDCTVVASPTASAADPLIVGSTVIAYRSIVSATQINVEAVDSSNNPVNTAFSLIVRCPGEI